MSRPGGTVTDTDRPQKQQGYAGLIAAVGNISVQYNLTSMGIGLECDPNTIYLLPIH